jgi:hypothetical protein
MYRGADRLLGGVLGSPFNCLNLSIFFSSLWRATYCDLVVAK